MKSRKSWGLSDMKSNWNKYTVGDITELVIDYRGKTPKKLGGDWCMSGYRALSAKNIKTGKIVQPETIRFVDEEMYPKWMKEEIRRGDIIITSEAPFGQIYYWDSDEKIVLSQRLFGLRIKKEFDSRFIYYYMITTDFQGELDGRATGTTVVGLRQPELMKCVLRCPDISTQKQISSILASIDQKIAINEQINDNLLQQIRLLISEYLPYSADDVVDNWHKISLSNIADFIGGYSYKGSELQPNGHCAMATIKNFARGGGFKLEGFKEIIPSTKLKPYHEVSLFDSLVAHTDLTQNADVIGNGEILLSTSGYDKIIMSMDLVKVVPKSTDISKFLIAAILADPRFKAHCLGYVNGTTVLHLSKKALPDYEILIPNDLAVLEPLCLLLESIYRKISLTVDEIVMLEKSRDELLPKLMSGEINVSNIDIE